MNNTTQTEQTNEHTFNSSEAAALIDREQVIEYFATIFGSVQWNNETHLCLRGIGEKGTPQEGIFRSDNFYEPSMADPTDGILNCVDIWARNQVACFVVPAVLRAAKGTAENVSLFTNIVADLDSGDTNERLEYMRKHVGEPTMVVCSGGTTDEGTPKRHVYYVLEEPTADVKRAILVRDALARKCGGDISMGVGVDSNPFGRAHQPVRVPGSVHAKKGIPSACTIESNAGTRYKFDAIEDVLQSMPPSPWAIETPQTGKPKAAEFDFSFSPTSGNSAEPDTILQPVYEGGTDRTRWSEFNKVAGLHIHMARRGEISTEEAYNYVHGWCAAYMNPPWPDQRIEHEFASLLSYDIRKHGPMPAKEQPIVQDEQRIQEGGLGLKMWAAHRWVTEPKPEHSYIVDSLVIKGEPHLFVAQGGAGKTFQVADLAMKIASYDPNTPTHWCGQKIVQGGTAVLILCEDSQTEMHRRLLEINSDSRIAAAGDRLIVLPMTKLGGAFPLVEVDYRTGETRPSKRWAQMLALLAELPDLAMVSIDTLNSVSHGDENSALAISQMMREAHRVCGELGAALIVNHHIRKTSKDQKIASLDDLSAAIRGSSAISSYFRINFGMFACGDYVRRMKAMGIKPEHNALWRFGVCKANIHGMMKGEKTLLRNKRGLMDDVTHLDMFQGDTYAERCAWLVLACRIAAERGHPYTTGSKNSASGLYRRRAELPMALRHLGDGELPRLLSTAMEDGLLVGCSVRGSRSKQYIDASSGRLASDEAGAEINSGAYTDVPDWSEYEYCQATSACVKRDEKVNPFQ